MFALVKFSAKCSLHDIRNILPVTKIHHFDAESIDHRKYYNIKCGDSYCQAIIISVDDSVEKLRAKVEAKRQVVPPQNLIRSASEISSEECSNALAESAEEVASRHDSEKRIEKKLNEKLEVLRQKHVAENTMTTAVGNKINSIEDGENIEPDGRIRCGEENTKKSSVVKRKANLDADGCSSGKKSTRSRESFDKPVVDKMVKPKKPDSSADIVKEKRSSRILTEPNAILALDNVVLSKDIHSPESGLDLEKGSTKSSEAFVKPVVDKMIKTKQSDSLADMVREDRSSTMTKDRNKATRKKTDDAMYSKNSNLGCNNSSHADFSQQIKNLKAKCSTHENTIAGQKLMIEELTKLNMELQRDVLQYFQEFKVMSKQYDGVIRNMEGCSAPPAGYISKKDQTIHLGHNVWIPHSSYIGAVKRAKSNQMFVKEIAIAVFGYDVLQNSSVTGTKSNKFKDKQAKPKLDETKMLAISDIYRYRLRAIQNTSEFDTQMELSKVQLYISRKISDMNRPQNSDKQTTSLSINVPGEDDQNSNAEDEINPNSAEISDADSGNSPIRVLEDEDNLILKTVDDQHKNTDLSAASDTPNYDLSE